MKKDELVAIAREAAVSHELAPELVCAICEQESSWNPWAMRYEPAFFERYVSPLVDSKAVSTTEGSARAFSWGLMQVMGQVAREAGFGSAMLTELCEPSVGLEVGCTVFAHKLAITKGDVESASAALEWCGKQGLCHASVGSDGGIPMSSMGTILDAAARRIAVVATLVALVLSGVCVHSWRDARDSRNQLEAAIEVSKKTMTEASDRETARDAQLKQALATVSAVKQRVQTPAQAAAAIPAALPKLPEPIEIDMPKAAKPTSQGGPDVSFGGTETDAAVARIPQADLKPLFDAAEDCRACQLKLAAAQADLADETAKVAAATSERNAALKVAKGGSTWVRLRHAAKWLLIGAAAGALAARAAR